MLVLRVWVGVQARGWPTGSGRRRVQMTLLPMVRALPERVPGEVTAVGVGDFALRRGHVYAAVIIDINSHRPLDVLPDRTAETVAAWLRRHPDVRIVCRDPADA